MAKIADLNVVYNEAVMQLDAEDWRVKDYLDDPNAALCVTNIYETNDLAKGFGQDFRNGFSVISSRDRISVINDGSASFYKGQDPLCLYADLEDDIETILMVLDAAIIRMEANAG